MFQLNFRNQVILGILLMGVGFLCANITKQEIFYKAGVVAYGLLFAIHPVYPRGITHPRMKLYMRLTGIAIVVIGGFFVRYGF